MKSNQRFIFGFFIISQKTPRSKEPFRATWKNQGQQLTQTNRGFFLNGNHITSASANIWLANNHVTPVVKRYNSLVKDHRDKCTESPWLAERRIKRHAHNQRSFNHTA